MVGRLTSVHEMENHCFLFIDKLKNCFSGEMNISAGVVPPNPRRSASIDASAATAPAGSGFLEASEDVFSPGASSANSLVPIGHRQR